MKAGDVFRFVGIADKHAWMIISDPARDPSRVLIVNFTSHDPYVDQACVVRLGDHPFIQHTSLVNYSRARLTTHHAFALLSAGRMEMLPPLSQALLKRIRDAAMQSTRIPLKFADILLDQELVN